MCVCVCVPSSLLLPSQGPIWLLWGPLLHGASAWFMGTGQPQLLSLFHRFISHTSPKTLCAYLPAPTALPPTDKLRRDVIFLRVGRILQTKILAIIYICCCPSALPKSLCALDLGGSLQSHLCFLLSWVTTFPPVHQILCTMHLCKDVCANYKQISSQPNTHPSLRCRPLYSLCI